MKELNQIAQRSPSPLRLRKYSRPRIDARQRQLRIDNCETAFTNRPNYEVQRPGNVFAASFAYDY